MITPELERIQRQVAAQHRVVAHQARVLADCLDALTPGVEQGHFSTILDFMGQRSAWLMETLGDVLNGMDAVSDEDAWVDPVFAEAQRLWPVTSEARQSPESIRA